MCTLRRVSAYNIYIQIEQKLHFRMSWLCTTAQVVKLNKHVHVNNLVHNNNIITINVIWHNGCVSKFSKYPLLIVNSS